MFGRSTITAHVYIRHGMALVITLLPTVHILEGKPLIGGGGGGAVIILVLNLFSALLSAKLGNFGSSIIEKVPPKDQISNFFQ